MHVDGIPPLRVDYSTDIFKTIELMYEKSEKYKEVGERDFLVVKGRNKIVGCTTLSELMRYCPPKKNIVYFSQINLPRPCTVYRGSLSLNNILDVIGRRRSLFVIKDGTKRKRFQNNKLKDVEAEITRKVALSKIFDESVNYPGLVRYPIEGDLSDLPLSRNQSVL